LRFYCISEILVMTFAQMTQIPSITLSIANDVDPEIPLTAPVATCKTFHEPIIGVLWAEINQLKQLLGCVQCPVST